MLAIEGHESRELTVRHAKACPPNRSADISELPTITHGHFGQSDLR
jgi:hypothetical protein